MHKILTHDVNNCFCLALVGCLFGTPRGEATQNNLSPRPQTMNMEWRLVRHWGWNYIVWTTRKYENYEVHWNVVANEDTFNHFVFLEM